MSSLPFLSSPRQARIRVALFTLHLWVGLTSGVLMALMGLSGAIMVFTPEIDQAGIQLPAQPTDSVPPVQQTVDRVATALGGKVRSIRFLPSEPRILQLDVATPAGQSRVFANRVTAEILKSGRSAWFAFIYEFHHDLFLGRSGRILTGILGVLLTLLAATGLLIWWPGKRRLRENPAFSAIASKHPWPWKVHNLVGFWSCLLIAVLAFTGTYFTWRIPYLRFFNAIAQTAAPAAPPILESKSQLQGKPATPRLDEVIAKAQAAVPGAQPAILRFPARGNEPLTIRMRRGDDLRRIGAHTVYLHPASGEILRVDDLAKASLATRLVESFAALHTGEFGNGPVRLVWALGGIAPALLFFSGFTLWWRKRMAFRRAETVRFHKGLAARF